jgi:hypothetical protein
MVETALKKLMAADAPAQDGRRFTLAVMARIERRDFYRALMAQAGAAALAALVLALVVPRLDLALRIGFGGGTSQAALAIALLAATIYGPRLLRD